MQTTRAFLEKKFDRLYSQAMSLLKDHDPCAVRGGACYSMRVAPERHTKMAFCCGGCPHLKEDGCSVESLYCRLWLCEPLEKANQHREQGQRVHTPLQRKLIALREEGRKYSLMVFRGDKEASIQQALRSRKDWKQ